jgi:NADH-quinone oxidoreductase subunit L
MVQAIVFLPLLGAIIAAVIALVGAHARCGSGDVVEHHGDGHGHSATTIDDAAGLTHEASGDHVDGDHDVVEPAVWGSRAAELITTSLLFVSAALS